MQQTSHEMQSARTLVSALLQQQNYSTVPAHSNAQQRNEFYAQVKQELLERELAFQAKNQFFANLFDCFIALFLIIGIITMLVFVVHLVMV